MKFKMILVAMVAGAALQGCATQGGGAVAEERAQGVCSQARVGTRIRNCTNAPVTNADRSILEQQIHRCSGLGCEGGGE